MGEVEQPSWKKVRPALRVIASIGFLWWLKTVLVSGFAWPMNLSHLSSWPWNQSWFMFYRSSGKHYYLQIKGVHEDGTPAAVSFEDYFKYPSSFHSPRFNEVVRDANITRRLAGFVCKKYNATAPSGMKLAKVTVWDTWWPDRPGLRRKIHDVPANEKETYTYVENELCSTLEPEART